MYKLVLVDDEITALNNIACAFDWESMGFELAAKFSLVDDTLDWLKNNRADVVITDINMPCKNGVQLAAEIRKDCPSTFIVFLSGHKDFDYAMQGMNAGVFSYLLKPVSFAEVEEICKKLKNELNAQNINNMRETAPMVLQRAVSDFYHGRQDKQDGQNLYEAFVKEGIDPDAALVVSLEVSIPILEQYLEKTWKYDRARLYTAIGNQASLENFLLLPVSTAFDKIKYVAVTASHHTSDSTAEIHSFVNIFENNCRDNLNLPLNISIGQICVGIFNYVKAESLMRRAQAEATALLKLVMEGKTKKVNDVLSGIQEDNDDFIRAVTIAFNEHLMRNTQIEIINIGDAQMDCLETAVNKALSHFNSDDSLNDYVVGKVVNYIKTHYMGKISLLEIASSVYMSEYHFCRFFKKKMGLNFVDYLNKIRIEQAQKLLRQTDLKVNEICTMVGYSSLKYFFKLFKSQTSMTPREYRLHNGAR